MALEPGPAGARDAAQPRPTTELALTATPPHSTNTAQPQLPGQRNAATFALSREPPADYRKLVVNGGSRLRRRRRSSITAASSIPGPTPFTSGDVSGEIYRYVVWRDDAKLPRSDLPRHPGLQAGVVAVKLDKPGNQAGERGYVEVQSDFVDPTDSAANDPIPGAERRSRHRAAVLPLRHPLRGERARPRARTSSATISSTTRSAPAPAGPDGPTHRAPPTRCCSAPRPTPLPPTPTTRRSTTTPTTSTSSRRPTPTRACRSAATTPAAATTCRPAPPTPSRRSTAGSPTR